MEIKRGDIFFADIPPTMENVIFGEHPILVVSNDKANHFSNVITCCPISSKDKKSMKTHVSIDLDKPSFILCELIMPINKKNLFKFLGSLSNEKLSEVNKALDIQLHKKNSIVFDINKVNSMLKIIQELEGFIIRYSRQINDMSEIQNSLNLHIAELKDYCYKCNVNYKNFYQDYKEGEMGENDTRAWGTEG